MLHFRKDISKSDSNEGCVKTFKKLLKETRMFKLEKNLRIQMKAIFRHLRQSLGEKKQGLVLCVSENSGQGKAPGPGGLALEMPRLWEIRLNDSKALF